MGGSSGKGTVLEFMLPLGGAQAMKNTLNVMKGEESFGSHENWFGDSAAGDIMNPMMGGNTQADRKAWDDYYVQQAKNDAAWKQAMDDNLQKSTGGTSVSAYKAKEDKKRKVIRNKQGTVGGSLLTNPDEWTMEDT